MNQRYSTSAVLVGLVKRPGRSEWDGCVKNQKGKGDGDGDGDPRFPVVSRIKKYLKEIREIIGEECSEPVQGRKMLDYSKVIRRKPGQGLSLISFATKRLCFKKIKNSNVLLQVRSRDPVPTRINGRDRGRCVFR